MADNKNKNKKEATRDYRKGNPALPNQLEELFPQGARVLNKINGKLGIIFWVVAGTLVISFLFSLFWPLFWGKILRVTLWVGGFLLVYKLFLYNWGIYAWATESVGRAIGCLVLLVGLAFVFFYLKLTTVGIITLLIAAIFGTAYFVRNKDELAKISKKFSKSRKKPATARHRHKAHL